MFKIQICSNFKCSNYKIVHMLNMFRFKKYFQFKNNHIYILFKSKNRNNKHKIKNHLLNGPRYYNPFITALQATGGSRVAAVRCVEAPERGRLAPRTLLLQRAGPFTIFLFFSFSFFLSICFHFFLFCFFHFSFSFLFSVFFFCHIVYDFLKYSYLINV